MRRERGVTWVEVLIVFAVCGILLAVVVFPAAMHLRTRETKRVVQSETIYSTRLTHTRHVAADGSICVVYDAVSLADRLLECTWKFAEVSK